MTIIPASRVFFTILFILKIGMVYSQCPTNVKALVNGTVINGDPSINITSISNINIVFKRGQQFNPQELREEVVGTIGSNKN